MSVGILSKWWWWWWFLWWDFEVVCASLTHSLNQPNNQTTNHLPTHPKAATSKCLSFDVVQQNLEFLQGALLVLLGEGVALLRLLARPKHRFHLFLAFPQPTELLRDCAELLCECVAFEPRAERRSLTRQVRRRRRCAIPPSPLPCCRCSSRTRTSSRSMCSNWRACSWSCGRSRADPSSEDCSASRLSKSAKVAACRLPEVMRARKPYRQAQKLVHSRQQQQQQHEEDKTKEGKP